MRKFDRWEDRLYRKTLGRSKDETRKKLDRDAAIWTAVAVAVWLWMTLFG
jgi:hypothetical protein